MFAAILKKELLDQILSPKFLIISLLCLVLVPASLLLNSSSYTNAFREYDAARKEARNSTVIFREPSALSAFGLGLENIMPKSVVFSKYQMEARGAQVQSEVLGNINGKVDFVVIVSFLLGLFAVLYAGTMACGEKETGTLKLILSNPVKRSTVIGAKLAGGFGVLLIPFALSTLIGLLLLFVQGFPLFDSGNAARIAAIIVLSVLYLAALFSLGLFLSTRTHKTSIALLAGFFAWILLTFIIPKMSEPIAGLIRPIPSEEATKANRAQVRTQIEKEKGKALAPLMEKYLPNDGRGKWDWAAYTKARGPVAQSYEEQIDQTLQKFDAAYEQKKSARRNLSLNLARTSPASAFIQATLNFCRTGVTDLENFSRSLQTHGILLFRAVFKYSFQDSFVSDDGKINRSMGGDSSPEGKIDYPAFRFGSSSFAETLRSAALDLILLVFFNLIFFAAAYVSFSRYDVR